MNNKIVVWVDADEVLVNFKKLLNQHIRENFSINVHDDFVPQDWYYQCVLKTKEKFNEVFNSLPSDWPLHLESFSGASDFTHELKDLGCRVVVITHLPVQFAPERLKNFVKHNLYFDEIFFTFGRDKCDFARELLPRYNNGKNASHLFIDDRALNAYQFFQNLPGMLDYAVTMNYPYNKEVIELCQSIPNSVFDHSSNTQDDMYKKILKRVHSELGKKNNK